MRKVMERGPIEVVPFEQLFPAIRAAEADQLRALARTVNAARPPGDAPTWCWSIDHSVYPASHTAGTPVILLTTVSTGDRSDWTELDLQVCWSRERMRTVTASVGVTCWCEVDHGTHYVEDLALLANGYNALAARFEQAVAQVMSWLAGPLDPPFWRARAELP